MISTGQQHRVHLISATDRNKGKCPQDSPKRGEDDEFKRNDQQRPRTEKTDLDLRIPYGLPICLQSEF